MNEPRCLLTGQEAARYLHISSGTLANMRSRGSGPRYLKFGDSRQAIIRYRIEDLQAYTGEVDTSELHFTPPQRKAAQ